MARSVKAAVLVLGAGLLACGGPRQQLPARPNVLILTVDTLRPDYLGFYGYDRDSSPFLDSLLAAGLVFDRATTPIPRTTPALASMLTGLYPHGHGVRTLTQRLGAEHRTLAARALGAGYRTVAVVSNHILTPDRGLGAGFEVYDTAPDSRDAAATTRAALGHVRDRRQADKLLLWVHYIDPHVPYHPPPELARAMDPDYVGPYPLHFGPKPGGTGDGAYPKELGKRRAVFRNTLPDAVNAHIRRLYAADIRVTDQAIRDLVAGLEQERGGDWLIVFTSDHGEALGEQDFFFYDHGDYVYEGGLAIPLALILPENDPDHRVGRVSHRVSLVDVAPTLAELLGLPLTTAAGGPVEGRSLVPYLRGAEVEPALAFAESGRSYFPGEIRRRVRFDIDGRFRAALDERWKLIWTPGLPRAEAFELYDLETDPGEQSNLFTEDHPKARQLTAALFHWLRRGEPGPPAELDDEDRKRLEALGYL